MAGSADSFVHLHNHTTYSLLDGAQKIDEMCRRAADDGQPAVAITDHGNLFGALTFAKQAKRAGIKPIVGLEAYVAPGSRFDRAPNTVEGVGRKNYYHLTLLAQNYTGYKNLIKLASAGYLEGFYYRPRIDKELLREHSEGLVCLSGCLAGEVATKIRHDRVDEARAAVGELAELFGTDRFWLEMQDHGIEAQAKVNDGVVRLSKETGVGLVASNDCHYLRPDDHHAHNVLICIGTATTVHDKKQLAYTPQHYLKTAAEMRELFRRWPEAVDNSVRIAEACSFELGDQSLHLPAFPVPDGFDLDGYFEHVAREGLERRLAELRPLEQAGRLQVDPSGYRERLAREIAIIREMGFSGYFLITWDFIRFARDNGIPVGPGRGSAAGSLVAYSMQITDIDPMQYDLLFERFLNPERVTMPDIDIDFCFRKREQVIEYVTHKYGRENVAQIITFGTMAARAAIRDVGRALQVPFADVDKVAKLVPAQPGQDVTIEQSLNDVADLRKLYEENQSIREMLDLAQRLEGLTRHASTHAAGVVIAPKPIVEYAPLYKGTKDGDEITTQFAKDEIEEIGLLKLDFLGLKTLTLIDDALVSIARTTGERPDLDTVPLDDPAVYELFCRARTSGIFQFESGGMKDILRRLKPDRFEDLIALNALYRPGPLGGGLVDDFIKRRHGKVKVRYPHPLLKEILEDTYGVIVYQEQVMQIASVMAGYSLGEADILRRAMGKKKQSVMDAEEKKFIERAVGREIAKKDAKSVFELMAYFAGYGFNKSHSAAYALVAFHTAWLKAHHPVHFMAALLTTEKGNTDKLVQYIAECREMGITVRPPDVNASGLDFTVEDDQVLFGLSAIKNAGEGAIRAILEARDGCERFESLHDLCSKIDGRQVNKRVIEALIRSGALDGFGARRSQLEASIDQALEAGSKARADREAGQSSLFGGDDDEHSPAPRLPDLPEWDEATRLANEKATLGFYVTGHPLEAYRDILRGFVTHTASALREADSGIQVAVGGIVTGLRRRQAKKSGAMWAQLRLEDLDGYVDVQVFPRTYETAQRALDDDRAVQVHGRLEIEDETVRIVAEEICPLEEVRERQAEAVQLTMPPDELDEAFVEALYDAVRANKGETRVFLELVRDGDYRVIAQLPAAYAVSPNAEFSRRIEALVGAERIRYRARPRQPVERRGRRGSASGPGATIG